MKNNALSVTAFVIVILAVVATLILSGGSGSGAIEEPFIVRCG